MPNKSVAIWAFLALFLYTAFFFVITASSWGLCQREIRSDGKITFSQYGAVRSALDAVTWPMMVVLTGSIQSPQQGHKWNSCAMTEGELIHIDEGLGVPVDGDPAAGASSLNRHAGVWGSWKSYVVVEPVRPVDVWHIGTISSIGGYVQRKTINGSARTIVGPGPVTVVGFDSQGRQIALQLVGQGRLDEASEYETVPLF